MHAAVLDDHYISGLPIDLFAVVNVVATALEHVEHSTVQVAVLLSVSARRIDFDMRFNRLGDGRSLRAYDVFAEELWPAFPGKIARRIDTRLLDQRLVEIAVGSFELSHEDALFCPALPDLLILVVVIMRGLIVALSRRSIVKACHSLL